MSLWYQCKLAKNNGEVTVGWIEARAAKAGARVQLLDEGYNKGELWTVVKVSHPGIEEELLKEKQVLGRLIGVSCISCSLVSQSED